MQTLTFAILKDSEKSQSYDVFVTYEQSASRLASQPKTDHYTTHFSCESKSLNSSFCHKQLYSRANRWTWTNSCDFQSNKMWCTFTATMKLKFNLSHTNTHTHTHKYAQVHTQHLTQQLPQRFSVDLCKHFGPHWIIFILFKQQLACLLIQCRLWVGYNQQTFHSLKNKQTNKNHCHYQEKLYSN